MEVGIILVWFVFAVLVGVLAEKNGRSPLLAFVLSILLSPLAGFVLYVFLGESAAGRRSRVISDMALLSSIREEKLSDRFVPKSEKPNDLAWVILGLAVLVTLLWVYFGT